MIFVTLKRAFSFFLLPCLFLTFPLLAAEKSAKNSNDIGTNLGFVDVEYVVTHTKHAETFFNQFKESDAKEEKAIKALSEKFRAMQAAFQKDGDTLSPAKTRERQSEMGKTYTQIQERSGAFNELRDERQQEFLVKLKPILSDIITKIAREKHYTAVFHAKGAVLYSETADITLQALKALDNATVNFSNESKTTKK